MKTRRISFEENKKKLKRKKNNNWNCSLKMSCNANSLFEITHSFSFRLICFLYPFFYLYCFILCIYSPWTFRTLTMKSVICFFFFLLSFIRLFPTVHMDEIKIHILHKTSTQCMSWKVLLSLLFWFLFFHLCFLREKNVKIKKLSIKN